MAEAILFDIAGPLLKNLGSRALHEIASAQGFKTRLDKLKNRVNTIKNVLDAEERQEEGQVESHAVCVWLDRLKAPLYAADDLFDEFATVASQREAMGKAAATRMSDLFKHGNIQIKILKQTTRFYSEERKYQHCRVVVSRNQGNITLEGIIVSSDSTVYVNVFYRKFYCWKIVEEE